MTAKTHKLVVRADYWDAVRAGEMRAILVDKTRANVKAGDLLEMGRGNQDLAEDATKPIGVRVIHIADFGALSDGLVMLSLAPMVTGPNTDRMMVQHLRDALTSVREIVDVEHPMSDGVRARLIADIDEALDADIPE